VEPVNPAVPADAFGALRLPLMPVPTVPPKQ
jgi:cholesterol oxidase